MNNKPTPRELACAFVSFLLLVGLFPSAEWIRVNSPEWIYKIVAGFLLGTVGAFSYATMLSLFASVKSSGWNGVDRNTWMRPFSVVFYIIIAMFGLIAWVVSWEGKTGIPYGLGVLVGASLMEAGTGSIIKKGK